MTKAALLVLLSVVFLGNVSAPSSAADKPKGDREGGIIGTGIVGTIQELGSIIVNGQRITYDPDIRIGSALGDMPASDLQPGETVVVVAHPYETDWTAQSIKLHYPLIGPATVQDGTVKVLGVSLDLSAMASAQIQSGDWIAVSGLWQDDRVMVSAIKSVPDDTPALISGSFMSSPEQNTFTIGSANITGIEPEHVSLGDMVTVTGTSGPNGLEAQRLRIGLFDNPMERIIVEGYMSSPTSDGLYTILGSGALAFTDTPSMIDTQVSGVFCIVPGDQGSNSAITPLGATCQ